MTERTATNDQRGGRASRRPPAGVRLWRRREGRVLGGVCAGIAELVGADVRTVRLLFVLSGPPSLGFTFLGYLLLWLMIPAAPATSGAGS